MNEEVKGFNWAEAASGSSFFLDDYYEKDLFNPQLYYWIVALDKFKNVNKDNLRLEEALLIINMLCSSLDALAGANINPRVHTPPLMKLYSETLKSDKGWDLPTDKAKVYKILKEMGDDYKNLTKHLNKSEPRKELLKKINYKKLCEYMDTTKEIWLWVLGKKFKGNIPKDQLHFFKDN